MGNTLLSKVEKCGKYLDLWKQNCFRNVRRELEKKKQIFFPKLRSRHKGVGVIIRELKVEINILLEREARIWSQRSLVIWASKGDSNTKYFHNRATKRHQKNTIRGIQDETTNGVMIQMI